MRRFSMAVMLAVVLTAAAAFAQQAQPQTTASQSKPQAGAQQTQPSIVSVPGLKSNLQWRVEQQIDEHHWKLIGDVEVEKDDVKISADEMDIYTDKDLLTAKGNVTLTTLTERISAESLEFNTRTKLGVFHHASGSSQIETDQRRKSQFGTQETQVLFYGETIEKIGYQKYRITKGGFTTCVQANPRWMLVSTSVVVNVNHYAMLKNSLFKVKGVPVLYLPVVYYPINKEDRATGFLLPAYGSSKLRGQSISNAFFLAMGRSQDATMMFDYFSRTGYGFGTEYRRVGDGGSTAFGRFYRLNEKPITFTDTSGNTVSAAGRQSFQVSGSAIQLLPAKLTARARVDYFSSVQVQQTYNFDVNNASQSQRLISGGVSGSWGSYGAGLSLDRTEYFYNATQSSITGALPRLSFSRKEQPLFGSPLYFAVGGDYGGLLRQTVVTDAEGLRTSTDYGVKRLDVSPRIRFPFTRWPFFTVNSSLGWRFTRWNQSLDPNGAQVFVPIDRTYFDMSAQFVGPTFNRIWQTPSSGYAEKLKHTIEPWFNIQRLTTVDNLAQIVKTDSSDYIVGGTTQLQYGLNTRLYAKRKVTGTTTQSAEQIFSLSLRQTYYSDSRAATYDPNYLSSVYFGGSKPQKVSPISLSISATPASSLRATFQTEYNTYYNTYLSFGASGTFSFRDWLVTSAGWSKRNYTYAGIGIAGLSHYLNSDTTLHFNGNKVGGQITFNWDLQNGQFLQQRFIGYYNAQCCGIILEYQAYDFSGLYLGGWRPPVTRDHRFSFGFSLAGIGTFANIFGALGGGSSPMPRF